MTLKILQVGGVVGGTALVLQIVFPEIPVPAWSYIVAISVSLIIYRGSYRPIEKVSLILIGLFTVLTLISVVALQFTPLRTLASGIYECGRKGACTLGKC